MGANIWRFYSVNQKKLFTPTLISIIFLVLLNVVLICYSILFFNESTPFPSLYSLVPTIGAALILLFGLRGTIVNKILTLNPIVFIGLVSYSAYLIHQALYYLFLDIILDDLTLN